MTSSDTAPRVTGLSPLAKFSLFLGLALTAMGQSVLFAIFGPIARLSGLAEWQAGAVISLSALIVTLVAPGWGKYSDRVGRRRPFVIAVIGFGLTTALFAALLQVLPGSALSAGAIFALLLLARAAYAVPAAAAQPAAVGAIADTTPPDERAGAMAIVGAAFGIGTILGPALAAAFSSFGPLVPLYLVALLAIPAALLACTQLPQGAEDTAPRPPLKETAKAILPLIAGVVAAFFAISSTQQSLAFYVQDTFSLDAAATAQRTGLVFMVLATANLIAVIAVSRAKPPTRPTLAVGGGLAGVGIALLLAVPAVPELLWVAVTLSGAGFGAFIPAAQGEASLRVAPEVQGAAGGLVASAMAGGFIIGPISGTALYGVNPVLCYSAATVAVIAATFLATYRGRA